MEFEIIEVVTVPNLLHDDGDCEEPDGNCSCGCQCTSIHQEHEFEILLQLESDD